MSGKTSNKRFWEESAIRHICCMLELSRLDTDVRMKLGTESGASESADLRDSEGTSAIQLDQGPIQSI